MKRVLCILSVMVLLIAALPLGASAQIVWNDDTISNDHYYYLASKTDWEIASGIWESEIVLNPSSGNRRQVVHLMEIDTNNPATRLVAGYAEMNPNKLQTATVSDQAAYLENNWGWDVVGGMNTALSWYNTEPYISEPHRKYESLGFMMVNEVILYDHSNGFPTCLVIHNEQNEAGEWLPYDIPKVQLRNIYSADDLNGFEKQVIPVSYDHWIVHNGVNMAKWYDHSEEGAPRSVVGVKADGSVVLMMNDGRGYNGSDGMTMYECAEVMMAVGCVAAVNCDGGGSSTFLSQRPGESLRLHCVPSDWGMERKNTNTILVTALKPWEIVIEPTRPSQPTTTEDPNGGWITIPTTSTTTSATTQKATTTTTATVTSTLTSTHKATTTSKPTTAKRSSSVSTAPSADASEAPAVSGSDTTASKTAPSAPAASAGQPDERWWIAAIGGGIAVLAAATVTVVLLCRRRKKQ